MQSPLHSKSCMLHNQHESFESFLSWMSKERNRRWQENFCEAFKADILSEKKRQTNKFLLTKIIYFLPAIKLVFFRKDPDINSIYFVSLAKGE